MGNDAHSAEAVSLQSGQKRELRAACPIRHTRFARATVDAVNPFSKAVF
jgi:hypothetical protein